MSILAGVVSELKILEQVYILLGFIGIHFDTVFL